MARELTEIKGHWFLPSDNQNKIPGTLRYEANKGAYLELDGVLGNASHIIGTSEYDIILGESFYNQEITLLDCLEENREYAGISPRSYLFANTAIFNYHFYTLKDIKFDKLLIKYGNIENWINIVSVKINDDQLKNVLSIKYEKPKPITLNIGNYEITMEFWKEGPLHQAVVRDINIVIRPLFWIKSKKEINYMELIQFAFRIRDFLSFAIQDPIPVLELAGYRDEKPDYSGEISINLNLVELPSNNEKIRHNQMLFIYGNIIEHMEEMLKNWLTNEKIITLRRNYLLNMYSHDLELESSFLNYIYGLEGYHRRAYNGFELEMEEHTSRIDKILNSAPEMYKKWLIVKLKYSNDKNFKTKISEILDTFPSLIPRFIDDKGDFIAKIADTRNYLVHLDEKKESKACRGKELYKLNQYLKLIFEICILYELSLNEDQIKELLGEKWEYRDYFRNQQ